MKTLANQTLLYDEDCPLCRAYTTAFVKTGMLDNEGRMAFCKLTDKELAIVDVKKAANEIALIDRKNQTVTYGIDSLLKVIGKAFPWMEKIGHFKPVHFGLKKLYAFISYNRKVIIPSAENQALKLQCIPDFNVRYRLAYLLFCIAITALILFEFSDMISLLPKGHLSREVLLAGGQLLFQGLFLINYNRKKILNYFGNLMTVSLMGSLLLLPIILLNQFVFLPELVITGWFGLVVLIMFLEHFRRVKLLKLPFYLSLTWILYRIIALLLILNL